MVWGRGEALQTLGGPDSALPSTDLREPDIPWGLLSSPAWPGGPAVSRGRRHCDSGAPGSLSLGAAAWPLPCVLWSLPPAETNSRHGPRATEIFPTFFGGADDGSITSLQSSSLLPALPKESELHRGRKRRAFLSTGALFSPESEKRQTGFEGTGGDAGTPGSWGWKPLCLGLAWPVCWDVSPLMDPGPRPVLYSTDSLALLLGLEVGEGAYLWGIRGGISPLPLLMPPDPGIC